MQKLVVVRDSDTRELNDYLDNGWAIRDYKLIANHVSASCGTSSYSNEKGSVFAYVLIERDLVK